jgi:hypothetical protein
MVPHIEEALRFAKAASDVVVALTGLAIVHLGELGGIGDEE